MRRRLSAAWTRASQRPCSAKSAWTAPSTQCSIRAVTSSPVPSVLRGKTESNLAKEAFIN